MLFVPAIGGLIVGVMARYGSKAIRGHGIPEAMEQVLLNESDACSHAVVTLRDDQRISEVHSLVPTHQGFPVIDRDGRLLGVVTRRDFIDREPFTRVGDLIRRPPAVVFSDMSLREAADHMVREEVGRLAGRRACRSVARRGHPDASDLLSAHAQRLDEARR